MTKAPPPTPRHAEAYLTDKKSIPRRTRRPDRLSDEPRDGSFDGFAPMVSRQVTNCRATRNRDETAQRPRRPSLPPQAEPPTRGYNDSDGT